MTPQKWALAVWIAVLIALLLPARLAYAEEQQASSGTNAYDIGVGIGLRILY